jgi:hypothetical protein
VLQIDADVAGTEMNTIQSKLKAPSRFLVTQLLAVGLTIALVVLAAYTAQSVLWHYALGETSRDRLDALDRDTFLTEARMRRLANDMFFLKGVAEAELASNPKAAAASENFRNAVRTMMVARSQYDQVRLLDPSGREIFRVNWLGGQHPLAEVPASGLQDKSDRPYYRETLVAAPDAAVFSPMDLNVEHGQVEQPLTDCRSRWQAAGDSGLEPDRRALFPGAPTGPRSALAEHAAQRRRILDDRPQRRVGMGFPVAGPEGG